MIYIVGIIGFVLGCFVGSFFKRFAFESQEWKILRWNKDTLGYRPIPRGTRLFRGDRVMMSLDLDSSKFPEEGLTLE